jgi:hypothetical protein
MEHIFLPRRNHVYAGIALAGIFGPDLYSRIKREFLQHQLTLFALTDRPFRRRVARTHSGAKP